MRMRRLLSATVSLIPWFCLTGGAVARDLSFEERVKAQEAIERVYYSHQIGATKPFEEAVSQQAIEKKVRTYLKQTIALERLWRMTVTAKMLQRETERMARMTRMPGRLHELYSALGKDSVLIQECLARPALVSRLERSFYWYDPVIHEGARQEAETLRAQLVSGAIDPFKENPNRFVIEVVESSREGGPRQLEDGLMNPEAGQAMAARAEIPKEQFEAWRRLFPSAPWEIGSVIEDREHFSIGIILEEGEGWLRAASFSVPKTSWDAWWGQTAKTLDEATVRTVADPDSPLVEPSGVLNGESRTPGEGIEMSTDATLAGQGCDMDDTWTYSASSNVPDPRFYHSAVWTGSTMIVWGGLAGNYLNTGGRYDPATDTWAPVSTVNAPSPRRLHSAIWTGSVMVVWGGSSTTTLGDGGRYDPVNDRWSPTSPNGAPSPRFQHVTVWTGSVMAVWGGRSGFAGGFFLGDGGRYDPLLDAWTPISLAGAPSPRTAASAVWTGTAMLVWGGTGGSGSNIVNFNTGGRYDLSSDTWSPVSTTGAPAARSLAAAAWTGSLVVIWGGQTTSGGRTTYLNTGGRYDPSTNTWTAMSVVNAPAGRTPFGWVWTGAVMVVWGGLNGSGSLATGGRYDPADDVWTATSSTAVPLGRYLHTAVWTGELMIVWGGTGQSGDGTLDTGGRYDPAMDTWTPTATPTAPAGREGASSIWTGNFLIVWGGYGGNVDRYLNTGGRYDPITDNWEPTSLVGAPWPRNRHTAVWTGTRMIVWGGECATQFGNCPTWGGRYDPLADTWEPVSELNAPWGRVFHTAIWTGNRMVVWGGRLGSTPMETGARYDPVADAWEETSTIDAPKARYSHAAVWTGNEMLIWGGVARSGSGSTAESTGGRYDPVADTWAALPLVNAPEGRWFHASIWTGQKMMVWGGEWNGTHFETGGLYDPSSDAWTPTSMSGSPSGRVRHSMVWSGRRVVIWGGYVLNTGVIRDTGGRYDPVTNTWSPISVTSVPLSRSGHVAAWTGDAMIVWGGYNGSYTRSGAFYCACEEVLQYLDADRDGYGDEGSSILACYRRTAYVPRAGDCNDGDSEVHPEAAERCNGADDNCDGKVDEGFDVGALCIEKVDECHQVIGNRVCAPNGMESVCAGTVGLYDLTPPSILCPPEAVLECPAIAANVGLASATDECDRVPRVYSDALAVLPLGPSVLVWTATDESGNSASCRQSVRVQDTIPPALTILSDPASLWPPNHEMVPVHVGWQVRDLCDPQPTVALVSVTSSEPDDAPGQGDGDTSGDIAAADLGAADAEVSVRTERAGAGPGRIYELTYKAVDGSGNAMPALGVVTVPHDQGSGPEPLLMRLEPDGTVGMVRIYWAGVPGAVGYDVISGDLSQVKVVNHALSLGAVKVLARGTTEASLSEGNAGAIPSPGAALFYLIQPRTDYGGMGYGTESAPWPRVPASCDGGCP